MALIICGSRFALGHLFITGGAKNELSEQDLNTAINRHMRGDWGDVCASDREQNEFAVENGEHLVSVYRTSKGVKFWIITEHDRSLTRILLPSEY